jgi:hypothetical protein
MVLRSDEESLIGVVRALPPEEAGKVLNWARQLVDLAGGRAIEWSDSWTDEDLAQATAAAVDRFDDEPCEDDWSPETSSLARFLAPGWKLFPVTLPQSEVRLIGRLSNSDWGISAGVL